MHFSNILTVVYKASCWYCDDFYIGKTKRRLQDWKTAYFKVLPKQEHTSPIADHIEATGQYKMGFWSPEKRITSSR